MITATSAAARPPPSSAVVVDAAPVFTSDDQVSPRPRGRGLLRHRRPPVTRPRRSPPTIALPAGLTLTDHGDGTATVAGTPTADGAFVVDLTAANSAGTARQGLSIRISSAPDFRSAEPTDFTEEESGSFSVEADGLPDADPDPAGGATGRTDVRRPRRRHGGHRRHPRGRPRRPLSGDVTATNQDPAAAGRGPGDRHRRAGAGHHRTRGPEQRVAEPDRPGHRSLTPDRATTATTRKPAPTRRSGQHRWPRPRGRRSRPAARPRRGRADQRVPAPERAAAARAQLAWLTVDMLKSGTRIGGITVRVKKSFHSRHRVISVGPDLGDPAEQLDRGLVEAEVVHRADHLAVLDQVDAVPGQTGEQQPLRIDLADVPQAGQQQPALGAGDHLGRAWRCRRRP